MENPDIRWQQRFNNFQSAIKKLGEAIDRGARQDLNELEKEGLIQRFEYTYELAWKTLQDLLRDKGYVDIAGPKPTLDQAFQDGYIIDAKGWQKMKKSRELSSHTYNSEMAEEITDGIFGTYYNLLKDLETRLYSEIQGHQKDI